MKIIVVGAGAVGSYLAARLSLEGQDVVVIEADAHRAATMQEELDALVITGNGASEETLRSAGAQEADLFIAVSSSDAVNVLACHAANELGIPITVARVEDPDLKREVEGLGVDLVIDPVETAAKELVVLAGTGKVAERIEFADGQLVLFGAYVAPDSPAVGLSLAELRTTVEDWSWLVVAVARDRVTSIARGTTDFLPGDHALIIAEAGGTQVPYELFGLEDRPAEKVVILGGTTLARVTASMLVDRGVATVLIDSDPETCTRIAQENEGLVVVCGDTTDPKVLREEGVGTADEVLALSGWDGVNLLGSQVARALGASEVTARFVNPQLVDLLAGTSVDATVSTRLSAANEILRFVRRGIIYSAVAIPGSTAEALELEVRASSKAIGRNLRELALPKSLMIGGVQRGGRAFVPRGDTVIEEGDHLIVVALPEAIRAAEELSG